jgi:hypothetical protein
MNIFYFNAKIILAVVDSAMGWFFIGWWGLKFIGCVIWANQNKDYPSSHKIMQALNCRVVFSRDRYRFFRMSWLALILYFAVAFFIILASIGWEKMEVVHILGKTGSTPRSQV